MAQPDGGAELRRMLDMGAEVKINARSWPNLDPLALHGLAGDVVRSIGPHTEAHPVAILVQFLAAVGSAIGRGPHYRVEGDRHGCNLFVALVGETSKGRKGTAWGRVREIMEVADPEWVRTRLQSGLSSGEGVIWAVRDPITAWERQGKGPDAEYIKVATDPGIADKRLTLIEPEFAGALTVMQRPGNIVSRVVRDAWDRGDLGTLVKNSPASATDAHVSIVGLITAEELLATLDHISIANGYANRFMWFMVRRANVLPFGGDLDPRVVADLGRRTQLALHAARNTGRMPMAADAREAWPRVYPKLSEGKPGLHGAVTGRAEAQTIRLALLFALLDHQAEIGLRHLQAGLAVWEYAEASVGYIWGDAIGDRVADGILTALRRAGAAGMTRTEMRDLFGRHVAADQTNSALAMLAVSGKARSITQNDTGGRPTEKWFAA